MPISFGAIPNELISNNQTEKIAAGTDRNFKLKPSSVPAAGLLESERPLIGWAGLPL